MTKRTQTIYTVQDAVRERLAYKARSEAKYERAEIEARRVQGILHANPEIGVLMRKGKPVYYRYTADMVMKESQNPQELTWGNIAA